MKNENNRIEKNKNKNIQKKPHKVIMAHECQI